MATVLGRRELRLSRSGLLLRELTELETRWADSQPRKPSIE